MACCECLKCGEFFNAGTCPKCGATGASVAFNERDYSQDNDSDDDSENDIDEITEE